MQNFTLSKKQAGLLLVDAQEKLFPLVERYDDVLSAMLQVVKGFHILNLPIIATEQYPQGLGHTIAPLKEGLGDDARFFTKTTFSCLGDQSVKQAILKLPVKQWVLIGIEAHVCILQTAKDLLSAGKEVVVLNDAISSRSIFDYSTAIAEMRDIGVRISSAETVLFELIGDSKAPEFKQISLLIK